MPTNDTLPAVAFRLVQLSAGSAWLLISARPTFTFDRSRPSASSVPPLMPAKPCAPAVPMVSRSTTTVLPSASVTVWLPFWMAKPPLTWKKPKASIASVPLASSRSPLAPSMSSFRLDSGPVAMVRPVLPDE
ncbi:hypothetical protein GCM10023144_23000 [Pigmentiphaga soli]|uniref:Uncharacterized protein n=1 Tax=Pigmentiphaga soli TaxID=1007095 RepID=A0ABP8H0T3_9BURK